MPGPSGRLFGATATTVAPNYFLQSANRDASRRVPGAGTCHFCGVLPQKWDSPSFGDQVPGGTLRTAAWGRIVD